MRKILLIALMLISISAAAQNRAWEFGVGASVHQFSRVKASEITTTPDGHSVDFDIRNTLYTGNVYLGKELSNVFTVDINYNIGKLESMWFSQLGSGIQFRLAHYLKSPYIDPYLRVGGGVMYKGYQIIYDTPSYTLENDNNKDGRDAKWLFPVSLGVGVNMWFNDYLGMGLQGDYLYIPKSNVANSLQGTVKLMVRIGGKSKKSQPIVTYVDRPVDIVVEVEKIVEVEKVIRVDSIIVLSELISSIHFDYNRYNVKPEYSQAINKLAEIICRDTNAKYLITGYTDATGYASGNMKLSLNRATAIKNALIQAGVGENQLKVKGQGSNASNMKRGNTESSREGDRKVTIEMVTNMEYWNNL